MARVVRLAHGAGLGFGSNTATHLLSDLGKALNLSEHPFPHLESGDNNTSHTVF